MVNVGKESSRMNESDVLKINQTKVRKKRSKVHSCTLTFEWKGKPVKTDTIVYIAVNGQPVDDSPQYSFCNGFSVTTCVECPNVEIEIDASKLLKSKETMVLEDEKRYVCTFAYSPLMRTLMYNVTENDGRVVFRSKGLKRQKLLYNILVAFMIGIWTGVIMCAFCAL